MPCGMRKGQDVIDVYIGIDGKPESMLELEFESFKAASDFAEIIKTHYKEEAKRLFIAIDNTDYYDLEEVFTDDEIEEELEIDNGIFEEICDKSNC